LTQQVGLPLASILRNKNRIFVAPSKTTKSANLWGKTPAGHKGRVAQLAAQAVKSAAEQGAMSEGRQL
jgi:hypothetical protein